MLDHDCVVGSRGLPRSLPCSQGAASQTALRKAELRKDIEVAARIRPNRVPTRGPVQRTLTTPIRLRQIRNFRTYIRAGPRGESRQAGMRKLLVILPASTAYRAPFFELVIPALANHGIQLTVAHGGTTESFSKRGDVAERTWSVRVPAWTRDARNQPWTLRRWRDAESNPDLVVVQQAIKNLETYPLIARQRLNGPRVAMWGHGKSYSTPQGPAASIFKQWLVRRCDWFFAYTDSGADFVAEHGFPPGHISVLRNTIDTHALRREVDSVTESEVSAFLAQNDLVPGRTALFLGGVDDNKGIDFLLASAALTAERLPGFKLLVAGEGASSPTCRAAQTAGEPVQMLGRVEGHAKALALSAADVLMIPQSIGLVAVDSLVAGVPIVSTNHPLHGPEAEYLEDGTTAIFVDHAPSAYADAVTDLLIDIDRLSAMAQRCICESRKYSLENMAQAFIDGILQWSSLSKS